MARGAGAGVLIFLPNHYLLSIISDLASAVNIISRTLVDNLFNVSELLVSINGKSSADSRQP